WRYGFYMVDEERILPSVDVNAKFINGKPSGIEAKYVTRSPREHRQDNSFSLRVLLGYSNSLVQRYLTLGQVPEIHGHGSQFQK
ncbi:unnamed protein product, partial [Ilex paraguariensis]